VQALLVLMAVQPARAAAVDRTPAPLVSVGLAGWMVVPPVPTGLPVKRVTPLTAGVVVRAPPGVEAQLARQLLEVYVA
jgi:hypothetical protein